MGKRDRVQFDPETRAPVTPKKRRGMSNVRPRRKAGDERFWWWQACPTIDRRKHWGALFETQAEAFEEAKALKETAKKLADAPRRVQAVGDALRYAIDSAFTAGGAKKTKEGREARRRRFLHLFYATDPTSGAAPTSKGLSDDERRKVLNDLEVPEHYTGPSLADFTTETISEFIAGRRWLHAVEGNTIRDDLSFLGRAFKLAGYRDHENPVYEARRMELWPVKTKQNHGEFLDLGAFKSDVLDPILASGQPECQSHHDVLLLVAATGIRNGELDRLRPRDIDYADGDTSKGGTLRINATQGRTRSQGKTKGESERFFGASLVPVLARLTIGLPHDGQICSGENLTNICTRWAKRLKVPKLNAENLRNTFQQAMVAQGDRDLAWRQAGHATSRMLDLHYTTHRPESARRASDDLFGQLDG
jgi:integrase